MDCRKVLIFKEGSRHADALYRELSAGGLDVSYVKDGEVREEADLLILCPDIDQIGIPKDGKIGTGHDYDQMGQMLSEMLYEMKHCVDSAVPFLESGGRRIAFITSESSSVSLCKSSDLYAEHMLLAAANMLTKMTFNKLRPKGFTLRCFAPSEGMTPGQYILQDFCYDANEPYIHSEENRLVLRNGQFTEIPW